MQKNTLIGIVVAAVVVIVVAYYAGQSSSNPASTGNSLSQSSTTNSSFGSESLCSRGAQGFADSMNKGALNISQSSDLPGSSYFVVSSRYVKSKDSCYFELHNQLPLPNNAGVFDDYTLYVTDGPSEWEVNQMAASVNAAEVAGCSTQENVSNSTSCHYSDPIKKQMADGSLMPAFYWVVQYPLGKEPLMSQQDFQSLVQTDMAAN